MDKIRVVIDTNVFIDGIFKGIDYCQAIFDLKNRNKISFVMNKDIQNELFVTFGDILKAALEKEGNNKHNEMFNLFVMLSKCLWQVEQIDHKIKTNYCVNDKSDNKFIDCCIEGNVKYLITSDNHINSVSDELKKKHDIEVLSPFQFYFKYKSNKLK